jgi:exonuclease SbcD
MKLLHTADIHLGFKTYGRRDRATGLNTRLLDVQRSFEAMVERALAEDIDVFLFCGDAYHTSDPTPTQQKLFARCLQPIADAGIPIVLITGNHDHPVTFGRASSLDIFEYLEGDVYVHRKPADAVQVIDTKGGPLQLIPLPWPVRSQIVTRDAYRSMTPEKLRQFIEETYVDYIQRRVHDIRDGADGTRKDGTTVPLSPERPTVLAGHVTVQGARLSGSERTSLLATEPKFTTGQLALPPIDYVALGHIHRSQDRNPDGHPPVVYAGSIERVTFKERNEPKGFYLVDIEPGRPGASSKTTTLTYAETPARRFCALQVDARDAPDPTERIVQAIGASDVDNTIVRVRYRVEETQQAQVDPARIRQALSAADKIAAIERQVDPAARKRRTVVTRDSTLTEALQQYIAQHDDLASMEDRLLRAAQELEAEYKAQRSS